MASTFKPQQAFEYAKQFIKDMPLDRVAPRLADDVHKIMWMAAPWRWTLGSMPVVTLTSSTQDYSVVVPGDLLFLAEAYETDGVTAPRKLIIEPTLPTTVTLVGQPSRLALMAGSLYRLSPKPGTQPSTAPSIISLYKKVAPTITASTMSTAGVQIFDDEWFWVFQEGFLWKAYLYADDARAGGVTTNSRGEVQYTGQRAAFESALIFMKANEKLPGGLE